MRTVKAPHERTRVITHITDEKTKAVQSEAKNSDINNIVAKAYQSGRLPTLINRQPIDELPDVESYQDAMNKVVFANQAFERLPSGIRAEFANSPQNMLHAVTQSQSNPEIKSKLEKLGILNPAPPAEQSSAGGAPAPGGTSGPAAPAAETKPETK